MINVRESVGYPITSSENETVSHKQHGGKTRTYTNSYWSPTTVFNPTDTVLKNAM